MWRPPAGPVAVWSSGSPLDTQIARAPELARLLGSLEHGGEPPCARCLVMCPLCQLATWWQLHFGRGALVPCIPAFGAWAPLSRQDCAGILNLLVLVPRCRLLPLTPFCLLPPSTLSNLAVGSVLRLDFNWHLDDLHHDVAMARNRRALQALADAAGAAAPGSPSRLAPLRVSGIASGLGGGIYCVPTDVLEFFPCLHSLDGVSICGHSLAGLIPSRTSLQSLRVMYPQHLTGNLMSLPMFTRLSALHLSCTAAPPHIAPSFTMLARLSALQRLSLSAPTITIAPELSSVSCLSFLQLDAVEPADSVALLTQFGSLHTLQLVSPSLVTFPLSLTGLTSLQAIDFTAHLSIQDCPQREQFFHGPDPPTWYIHEIFTEILDNSYFCRASTTPLPVIDLASGSDDGGVIDLTTP